LNPKPFWFDLFLFRNDFYGRQCLKQAVFEAIKIKAAKNSAKIAQNFFSYGKQSLEALCFYSGAFFYAHIESPALATLLQV